MIILSERGKNYHIVDYESFRGSFLTCCERVFYRKDRGITFSLMDKCDFLCQKCNEVYQHISNYKMHYKISHISSRNWEKSPINRHMDSYQYTYNNILKHKNSWRKLRIYKIYHTRFDRY